MKYYFSSTMSRTLSKFGLPPKPACSFLTVPGSKLYRPSSRSSWRKVWTGVKCNFSLAHLHEPYVVRKLLISRVWMWNFTRIERKTKKLPLSINPARRQWPGTTHKKVWTTTFLRRNSTSCTSLESSRSRKLRYAVSAGLAKSKKITALLNFCRKT